MKEEKKCNWPRCHKEIIIQAGLPVKNEKDIAIPIGFCTYHGLIAISGHFDLRRTKDDGFLLNGPFPETSLIESVIAARETTKKNQPKNKEELLELIGKND